MALTSVSAKDYTGSLDVIISGNTTTTESQSVSVTDNGSNAYTLSITDFTFGGQNVGNITLSNVKGETQADGSVKLTDKGETVTIKYTILLIEQSLKVNVVINEALISADGNSLNISDLQITNAPVVETVSVKFYMPVTNSYNGTIGITVNGVAPTEQPGTIKVTHKGDSNNYTLSIENFSYGSLNLGTVTLSNVTGTTQPDGSIKLIDEESITAGVIPAEVKLTDAVISADGKTLTVTGLSIAAMSQNIAVTFTMATSALKPVAYADATITGIYTLTGKKVSQMGKGFYIVTYSNGTNQKVFKK